MRYLTRALAGIFLAALTLALIAQAGRVIWFAFEARMMAEAPAMTRREQVVTVNALTVTPVSIAPELVLHGEIRASRTLDLRAAVAGSVDWVSPDFVEGGQVRAGDLLLRLDTTDADMTLALAQADLADAEAEGRDAGRALPLAQDELAAAEAQASLRAQALQRQRDLQARGIGTAPDLEAAELAASSADQTVLVRRQAIATAEARMDQAASAIARARLAVEDAQRRLTDTELRAEFDGILTGAVLPAGARVTANELVGQLIDPMALEVSFRLSTAQHLRLIGTDGSLLAAEVRVASGSAGAADAATGTIARESAGDGQAGRLVFAALGPAPGLRPGDFVTVTVTEPVMQDVAVLPATAVGSDGAVLLIGPEDRLVSQPVEVLRRQGDNVIVTLAGLEGARVVAERSPLLGTGIRVRPAGTQDAAAMLDLTAERRAGLVALVESNARLTDEMRARLLAELAAPRVPAEMVARIEARAGG